MSRRDSLVPAPGTRPRRSRWAAFLNGVGSIFDLCGSAPRPARRLSDAEALQQDWNKVGQDLYVALVEVAHCDDGLRLELAREAGENYEGLVRQIPGADDDPARRRILQAAADRQQWFRTALLSGGTTNRKKKP